MAEILKQGLLTNLKSSQGRREAILLVLHELKTMKKNLENDPAYKDPQTRRSLEMIVPLLVSTFLIPEETTEETGKQEGEGQETYFPTKEEHYHRNQYMPLDTLPMTPEEAEKLGWDDGVAVDCHQFTAPHKDHIKFVSPDGKSEVIFDCEGDMVTAPEDEGTYNFADPNTDPIGHFNKDVLPWIIWGNEESDSTDMSARLHSFVIDGGLHAIRKKENE